MSYSYSVCYCRECENMNLNDRNRYDREKAYCTEYRKYFNINDKACSRYFKYDENRCGQRGGCYITTLVCDILKVDDSYLDTLRTLRESYMKHDINMFPLLYEYDIVGPIISDKLREDENIDTKAMLMFKNYIEPISKLINEKKYTEAIKSYTNMIEDLKAFYNIETPEYEIDLNTLDIKELGKGHALKMRKN